MGPINAAFNMKEYFAEENLRVKNVSAQRLNGGGRIVRERTGGGEMFEVEWPGG